jgi:hypothetical protein
MKDLTKYSYDEQVDRMTLILKDAAGWGDGFDSSMGQTLIQMVADITDNLHFMLERRSAERYLSLAKLRSSIIARAGDMGYRMKRAVANEGLIRINLVDANGDPLPAIENVTIPALSNMTFAGQNFVLLENVSIEAGDTFADFTVKAGTVEQLLFEITEPTFINRNYILIPNYENFDNDFFQIISSDVEYTDVRKAVNGSPMRRALSFCEPTDTVYDIRYTYDGMRVVFGDNSFGKKPDSTMTVNYIAVPEENAPVLTVGNNFVFDSDTVLDIGGNSYFYVAQNTTTIVGYMLAESNDSIKENAIAYHQSNGRAVSNTDYNFWIKEAGIGNIIDVKTSGEYELDSTVYNMNNVYCTYLTEDSLDLTIEEETRLRTFIDDLKVNTTHLVLNPAEKLFVGIDVAPVKQQAVPISNAELYSIVYNFLIDYFKLTKGSIGRKVQVSDIISAMYDLTVTRQNVNYRVIDYVKIIMNAYYPFSVPVESSNAYVQIDSSYVAEDNKEFVLIIDNLVCTVPVNSGDTNEEILLRMRDKILQETPFIASVELVGVALDGFGNPIPVVIDPLVGTSNLLIGIDTPYFSPTSMVGVAAVGSSSIAVITTSPAITVKHYYYSSLAGRRPRIPLRDGTTVRFTAPTDTAVNVYTRLVMQDPSTEQLLTTIAAGDLYEETFDDIHSVEFEYVSSSIEDVEVEIEYPNFEGTALGINIRTKDGFGKFNIRNTSGDLTDAIDINYTITVPEKTKILEFDTRNILEGTLSIVRPDGSVVYRARSDGFFEDSNGVLLVSGKVDYISGEVTLPIGIPVGNYYIKYDQDKWQNLSTDDTSALVLIPPKPTFTSTAFSLSRIDI